MKKTLSLLSASLFFFSLYINFLAGTGGLNDIATGEISGLYPTLFTPAGLTFSIWGLIFLLNTFFVISQIYLAFRQPGSFSIALSTTYIILSLANMSWLFLWHHLHIGLSLMVIIVYLLCTLRSYQLTSTLKGDKTNIHRFANFNFSIYAGWLSVATIANTAVCLTTIGVPSSGSIAVVLTILVLIVALLLAYFFLFNQRNFWYPLVISWALFGIYLASSGSVQEGSDMIKWVSITCLVSLLLLWIYRMVSVLRMSK